MIQLYLAGKLILEKFEGLGDDKFRLTLIHREKGEAMTLLLTQKDIEELSEYLDLIA